MTTPSPAPAPAPTPSPTTDVNSGRTAVTLGNGSTVYYDTTGQAYDASGATVSNSTIDVSRLGSTLAPPTNTSGAAPVLPPATAPTAADNYQTSLSSTLANQQSQLQASYQQQQQKYQTQIDALNADKQSAQDAASLGLANENSTVQAETTAKQQQLDQYNEEFQKNYDSAQKLTDQLQSILATGQAAIDSIKGTSGLSSIMNARVSQTLATVQGQAGVITATLAAYNNQMGAAKTHIDTAMSAISSIYSDQLSYWKNVQDFYTKQAGDDATQITALSKDEQAYVDAQIKMQQDNLANTQATAQIIQKAMLDPQTALTYAKAGVSLTDTPAQINQKLAVQAQADTASAFNASMVKAGYSTAPIAGAKSETVTDQYGKTWYKTISTTQADSNPAPGSTGAYPKGTMAAKQYVELSLQRAGKTYAEALAAVPQGKVGVVQNSTGQIGYINPTEFTTKDYTYL